MESFILDTNIFFNMEASLGFGNKTEEVVDSITAIILRLKKARRAAFFMPPRIVAEFLSFFEENNQSFVKNLLSAVDQESPDISDMRFSATIFYKLIEDVRLRNYRGLSIAEEEMALIGQDFSGRKIESKKDFQMAIGRFVKKFRERYRNATRTGFLDSLADLDLIVLAKQKNGFLVSTDRGVLDWGRFFGVKEMPASVFRKRLEDLLVP